MNCRMIGAAIAFLNLAACADVRAQARTSDSTTVRSLDDQERTAALQHDGRALERLWSDNLVVNAPRNEVVVGKRAVLDIVLRNRLASFERRVEYMRVDGDLAVIMGSETVRSLADVPAAGLRDGQVTRRRFTNIWKREGGSWRLGIRHAHVVPD